MRASVSPSTFVALPYWRSRVMVTALKTGRDSAAARRPAGARSRTREGDHGDHEQRGQRAAPCVHAATATLTLSPLPL